MGGACGCRQKDLVLDEADPRAHRGHRDLRARCTASRHRGGAEDGRTVLYPENSVIYPLSAFVSRSVSLATHEKE